MLSLARLLKVAGAPLLLFVMLATVCVLLMWSLALDLAALTRRKA
jgi:hypothetical protein